METSIIYAAWLVAGLVLGLVFARLAARAGGEAERWIYAGGLVVVAAVYPVLAWTNGVDAWLPTEIVAALVFAGLAVLGLVRSPLWLSGGWVLHAAWDSPFHLATGGSTFVPVSYILVCASFDLVVALAIYFRFRRAAAVERDAPKRETG